MVMNNQNQQEIHKTSYNILLNIEKTVTKICDIGN